MRDATKFAAARCVGQVGSGRAGPSQVGLSWAWVKLEASKNRAFCGTV